jgi:putative ABC transport system permease protein
MALSPLRRTLRPLPILRLAVADLRDEWLLSLCIAMAVAAVLSPLMILFGLKNGAIEILRERLVEDPRNREIRPRSTQVYEKAWFDTMRQREDVAFITPLTRTISSSVGAMSPHIDSPVILDLAPTGRGDALVLENGAPVPGPGQCVLTSEAADSLGVKTGESIEIRTSRRFERNVETVSLSLKVAGILDLRAGGARMAYVPLSVVEAVEQFLDGHSVPEFGWEGSRPLAYPEFDGALLLAGAEGLSPTQERAVVTATGFAKLRALSPQEFASEAGFYSKDDLKAWLLEPAGSTVRTENFEALAEKLRGTNTQIIPWIANLEGTLSFPDNGQLERVKIKSLPDPDRRNARGPSLPDLPLRESSKKDAAKRMPALFATHLPEVRPPSGEDPPAPSREATQTSARDVRSTEPASEKSNGETLLRLEGIGDNLTLPLDLTRVPAEQVRDGSPHDGVVPGTLLLSSHNAGILRLAVSRPIERDPATGDLLLLRRGYAGFRLFAKSIDEVDGLRQFLESQDILVFHEAERINDVRNLDRQLSRFFWFIAAVGIAGAVATLAASLYASAERKTYELAVLRLLGLRRLEIVQFPAWQALILTSLGFLIALCIYGAAAAVLGQVFQDQIRAGEQLAVLPAAPVTFIFFLLLALALFSSFLASLRIFHTDLSEALREGGA